MKLPFNALMQFPLLELEKKVQNVSFFQENFLVSKSSFTAQWHFPRECCP